MKFKRIMPVVATEPVWQLERDGVTQSLLANFLLCPEKLRLGYVEGWRNKATTKPIAFGSVVHDALEKTYNYIMETTDSPPDPERECRRVLSQKEGADQRLLVDNKLPKEHWQTLEVCYGMAEGILPKYIAQWEDDFQNVTWLDLEREFCIVVEIEACGRPWRIPVRGKLDGAFRNSLGEPWLFETKTKGQIDADFIMAKLNFDFQVMLYLWAFEKIYGEVPKGVIYNVMRTPQLRQKKSETLSQFTKRVADDVAMRVDHYFLRFQASIPKSDVDAWYVDFINILKRIAEWENDRTGHYKNPYACGHANLKCQFINVCAYGDTSGFERRTKPFSELSYNADDNQEDQA